MPASTIPHPPSPAVALPMAAFPLPDAWERGAGARGRALTRGRDFGDAGFTLSRAMVEYGALPATPRGILADAHILEVLPDICHPYADVEWEEGTVAGSNWRLTPEMAIDTVRNCAATVLGFKWDNKPVVEIMTASGDKGTAFKHSFHIVWPGSVLDKAGIAAFGKQLVDMAAKRFSAYRINPVDASVYTPNHLMRALYQTKATEPGRPFTPYGDSSKDFADHLIGVYTGARELTWHAPIVEAPAPAPVVARAVIEDSPETMDFITQSAAMLNVGRADTYDTWAAACWLFKSLGFRTGNHDALEAIWTAFSAKSPKHDAAATAKKWDEARDEGFGFKTLREWANADDPERFAALSRARGREYHAKREAEEAEAAEDVDIAAAFAGLGLGARVDGPAELPAAPGMEAVPMGMRVSTFVVPTGRPTDTYERVKTEFEKSRVVVNNPFHFMRLNADGSFQRMAKATMVDMHQNIRLFKEPGAKEADNFMKLWLTDPTRRTLEKVDFYPPPLVVPENCYNTFTGFKAATHAPVAGVDLTPILHHMDVLVGHTPGGREYMLDWLAFLVQRPGIDKHMATAILFKGAPGTGKTSFIDWIGNKIIGAEHYRYIDDAENQLFARFSNAMTESVLVCIDEAHQLHKHADKFKAYISQVDSMVEVKGIQPVRVNNFARFMLATNNDNPFKIEGGDRRFGVFKVSPEHKGDVAYFKTLSEWMEDTGNVRGFFDMLMARDIAGVHLQDSRPKTDEYVKMQMLNVPAVVEFLVEQYEARDGDAINISGKRFRERFMEWARANNRAVVLGFSSTYMTQLFSNYGVEAVQMRMEGKIERGYRIDWVASRKAIEEAFIGVPLYGAEVVNGELAADEED